MSNLLEEVKNIEEGFSSDAQRRAAFASGYKEKGKKKKDEAVSPAQQAAIAISKKEKGEKPKDEKDEGNEFGMALKSARDKGEKTFVVSGKKYNVTEEEGLDIQDESEYTIDESKMKELAMRIADVYMQMKKDSVMKPFADRFRADVKRSLDIRKSLEKVLPDYVDGAKITTMMKEEETDEAMSPKAKAAAAAKARQDKKFGPGGSYSKGADAIRKVLAKKEDVEVTEGYFDEQKSSTGYDLYHKEFSGAMQHAYAHAKKKFGITIKPDEIDDKVATGPSKPSKGKTNSYKLKGDKGSVQIQVYNMGSKYELNMYKEEVENKELDEGKKKPVSQMTPKEKAADAARRKEYKDYQKSKREEVENEELDEAQIAALTKANIKHTAKQHPMKRSKTMVNVSRKDYKAAEKALGKEASSQGDDIMLGISEEVKLGGMPAGLSKKRIKADRDVYAQVLGIREALDPADFDISATSKDKEQADKNVILQLRKVISLNGTKPVEFSNGKKEKVHPNVATAALNIHRKLRRTDEKDAFQQKIAKSYRDLLNAVKGK